MEADHSEGANVCSVGKVGSKLEADAVTGLWKAGEKENCLDGRGLEPEALCELLNHWIMSLETSDTEHYMVAGAGSEMYGWSVVGEKLTLSKPEGELEESASPMPSGKPLPSGNPASSVSPMPTEKEDGNASSAPSENPEQNASPAATDKVNGNASPEPIGNPEQSVSPTPTEKEGGNASPAKKTKWKAPIFKLSRKVSRQNQKYIQVTLKKYKGKYVQVWVKIEGQRYRRIKLSENRISKLHGKLKFKYSFSNKKRYFKLRTYGKKNGKKVYSAKSKGKRITTK